MTKLFDNLEVLCQLDAIAGYEKQVSRYLVSQFEQMDYSVYIDGIGNVICHKEVEPSLPTVGLIAHMDEIGFVVKKIEDNGLLRIHNLGGIFSQTLLAQEVKVYDKSLEVFQSGTILAPPIHQLNDAQKKEALAIDTMYVDIGLSSKQSVLDSGIEVGAMVVVVSDFKMINECIMSKAIDDRYGCAMLLSHAKENECVHDYNLMYIFTTQEEVGLRGAQTLASYELDLALIVDASASSDVIDRKEQNGHLHEGVLLRHFDPGMITSRRLLQDYTNWIEANKFAAQPFFSMGSTDGAKVQCLNQGIPTLVVGVCMRNIHTCRSVASYKDIDTAYQILSGYLEYLNASIIYQFKTL